MTTTEMSKAEQALEVMTPIVSETVRRARSLATINDHDSFLEADQFLVEIKRVRKRLDDERKKFTAPIDLAKKQIMDSYKPKDGMLSEAEMILKGGTRKWFIAEQERKRKEEQRRIEEERKRQEEANLNKAVEEEKNGNNMQAEKTLTAPIIDVKPKVSTSFDEGRSYGRKVWKCRIVSVTEFLKGVVEGKVDPEFVTINVNQLSRSAQAMKGKIEFPGVEVVEDVVMGVRG